MRMFCTSLATAALLVATQAQAATDTITFEGLADGEIISTIGNATFSGNADISVYDFGGFYAHSGVNTIAEAGENYNGDLFVDFASVVSGLSFYSSGDDSFVAASIRVFVNGVLDSVVDLVGDGIFTTVELQDLSAFSNVSRIEIFNVTDPSGLVYDDFTFTYQTATVPLPATALLLTAALGGLGLAKRRRRA